MLIDFRKPIKDLAEQPITETEAGPDGKPKIVNLTLSRVAVNAVLGSLPEDREISGEQKLKRFLLAQKILNAEVELELEDVKLIKDRVGKVFGPLIVGRAFLLLDPSCAGEKETSTARRRRGA